MNTLFINIIGRFFFKKKKTKLQKTCIKKKNSRDAGLFSGLEESPGPAGTMGLPLQVLAPVTVTVTGARSCLCAPALLGFLGFLFLFFCVCV